MKTINIKFNLIIVLFLFVNFVFAQDKKKTETIVIKTSSICGTCKYNIEKALSLEKGVKSVVLDVDSKIATIVYKPSKTNPDKLRKAISEAGYDADEVKANPKAYENLAPCCKKEFKGTHGD